MIFKSKECDIDSQLSLLTLLKRDFNPAYKRHMFNNALGVIFSFHVTVST